MRCVEIIIIRAARTAGNSVDDVMMVASKCCCLLEITWHGILWSDYIACDSLTDCCPLALYRSLTRCDDYWRPSIRPVWHDCSAVLNPRYAAAWPLSLSNRNSDVYARLLYALGISPSLSLTSELTTPSRLSRCRRLCHSTHQSFH